MEKIKGQIVDKSILVPGDIVTPAPDTNSGLPQGEYVILWTLDNGFWSQLGMLTACMIYVGFKGLQLIFERHTKTDDIKKLIETVGLVYAVQIREKNLPKGFLNKLTTEELNEIYSHLNSQFHPDLDKKITRIIKSRRKIKPKILNAEHVKSVCRHSQGEKTCSYLVFGDKGISCAKHSDPELHGLIFQRRMMDNIVAKGDYCPGRTGAVALEKIGKRWEAL